jgi:uncharacterized protein YkwD
MKMRVPASYKPTIMKAKALLLISVFLISLKAFTLSDDTATLEQQLVDQLNQSRRQAGLPALSVDRQLTEAARQHSQLMSEKNTLGHVLPGETGVADRLAAVGVHFNRSGENVGYNSDFNGIHAGFMKSPPHRENILNPNYTQVGIGVVKDNDGVYWVTEDFAHIMVQRTADQAEDLVARNFETLRRKSGGGSLRRVDDPKLHNLACNMAQSSRLDPKQVLSLPGVRYAIIYNNSRPEELPSSVRTPARDKTLQQYTVGACFSEEKSNPGGTYYVVMAFY